MIMKHEFTLTKKLNMKIVQKCMFNGVIIPWRLL